MKLFSSVIEGKSLIATFKIFRSLQPITPIMFTGVPKDFKAKYIFAADPPPIEQK